MDRARLGSQHTATEQSASEQRQGDANSAQHCSRAHKTEQSLDIVAEHIKQGRV